MRRALTYLPLAALLAAQPARAQSQSTPTDQSAPTATPAQAAPSIAAAPAAPAKTSDKSPLLVNKWQGTLYGFAELDAIYDTKQYMTEVPGNPVIPRAGYAANHDRLEESMRNSRLGFRFSAPEYRGMRASGLIETDFFGNQPNAAGGGSEGGFYNNAGLRVRHAYAKLETPLVDVVGGQTWELFGWQSHFHPATLELQGVPGQVYSRTTQLRLSHVFKSEAVNVEFAVAAARPVERDSGTPDGQAGVRMTVNQWKSVRTAGGTGTSVDPLGVGVSGVWRKIVLNSNTLANPTNPTTTSTTHGWGVSVDGILPIIQATLADRSNALTVTGSWVKGEGIQDMYSGYSNGGTGNQLAGFNAIDNGIVAVDSTGKLVAAKVQSFIVGAQYYLPIDDGAVFVSGTYSDTKSDNAPTIFGNTTNGKSWKELRWLEAALFWDVTQQIRLAGSWGWFENTFPDAGANHKASSDRYQLSMFYIF